MCIPIKHFTTYTRVSIPTDRRNPERQLWSLVVLSCYSWDHQTWPPRFDWFILHLGKLELSDETSDERL